MGSYEYHEFRAIDRPLTSAEQRNVAGLSSRADVSAHHASFVYNYSSFRGDPDELLTSVFDAMFYIASWGNMLLVFSLPKRHFAPARADPYLVHAGELTTSGVQARVLGDRVLVSVGLDGLGFGWVEGEGWLEPMLPLREGLLAGDDRPLYLFWLAAYENGLVEDDERNEPDQKREPPVPPGMGELEEAHRDFARNFEIPDGLLVAATSVSQPSVQSSDDRNRLIRAIETIDENNRKEMLLRVGRGACVEVQRELRGLARSLEGETSRPSCGRTLDELARVAAQMAAEQQRRARLVRLEEIEANQARIWTQVESRLASKGAQYREPVKLLAQLHDLAKERGDLDAFFRRLERLGQYGKSKAFMQRLNEAGITDG
jgi:hypothetical protein